MVRVVKALLVGLFFCSSLLISSHSEEANSSQPQSPNSATTSASAITPTSDEHEGLIHLDVAATDSEAQPASHLAAKELTLLDNGIPQKVLSFSTQNETADENERLTEVVLLLDEVNLSPERFAVVKNESIEFLRQNGGHLDQSASVYWFTTAGLYASAKPTTDGNALAEDIAHHRAPRAVFVYPPNHDSTLTAQSWRYLLRDRALQAIYSIAVERRDQPGRKLLVWMGFGWPMIGGPQKGTDDDFSSLVELSTRIREARLVISEVTPWSDPLVFNTVFAGNFDYTAYLAGVRTAADLEHPYLHSALPVLAMQSGGLFLDAPPDFLRAIERCVRDASAFSTISFDPPRAIQPDEYHHLEFRIGSSGITTRAIAGYYDQPVFYDQPRVPGRQVTVHELEQILDQAGGKTDAELAAMLAQLQLTERFSSTRLTLWKDRLHGRQSKSALTAMADDSVFSHPPPDDMLSDPAPAVDTQRQMLLRTVKYLAEVIPRLPNFFATRTTIHYEQRSAKERDNWKTALGDQSLHEAATQRATLQYRNGQELQEAEKKTGRVARGKDLNFIGIFGPILGSVLADATRTGSKLVWSRWEPRTAATKQAVFTYTVTGKNPNYSVAVCCLRGGKLFRTRPEYHGELAIDPETGAILRLTMESQPGWILEPNLHPVLPVKASGMMVEYGPVEIGGKRYTCPLRSVVKMRIRTVRNLYFWDEAFEIYAPYETLLNDIVYSNYHKFGSESRILPRFDVVPDAKPSPPGEQPSH